MLRALRLRKRFGSHCDCDTSVALLPVVIVVILVAVVGVLHFMLFFCDKMLEVAFGQIVLLLQLNLIFMFFRNSTLCLSSPWSLSVFRVQVCGFVVTAHYACAKIIIHLNLIKPVFELRDPKDGFSYFQVRLSVYGKQMRTDDRTFLLSGVCITYVH